MKTIIDKLFEIMSLALLILLVNHPFQTMAQEDNNDLNLIANKQSLPSTQDSQEVESSNMAYPSSDDYSKLLRAEPTNLKKATHIVITDNVDGKEMHHQPSNMRKAAEVDSSVMEMNDPFKPSYYFYNQFITNVFTPNGDGINDQFKIDCIPAVGSMDVIIFNRWGETVFKSLGQCGNAWDGTRDQKQVGAGVYFYIINAGKGLRRSGPLTILY